MSTVQNRQQQRCRVWWKTKYSKCVNIACEIVQTRLLLYEQYGQDIVCIYMNSGLEHLEVLHANLQTHKGPITIFT